MRRSVGGGYGIVPISYSEIDAYSRLMREPMTPFEVRLIRLIDEASIAAASTEPPKTSDGKKLRSSASAKDGKGVATMFRDLGAKPKRKRGQT